MNKDRMAAEVRAVAKENNLPEEQVALQLLGNLEDVALQFAIAYVRSGGQMVDPARFGWEMSERFAEEKMTRGQELLDAVKKK